MLQLVFHLCLPRAEHLRSCTCDTLYEKAFLAIGAPHGGPLGRLIARKVQRRERDVHDELQTEGMIVRIQELGLMGACLILSQLAKHSAVTGLFILSCSLNAGSSKSHYKAH